MKKTTQENEQKQATKLCCGNCKLFENETFSGDGFCEFHQEPRNCSFTCSDHITVNSCDTCKHGLILKDQCSHPKHFMKEGTCKDWKDTAYLKSNEPI